MREARRFHPLNYKCNVLENNRISERRRSWGVGGSGPWNGQLLGGFGAPACHSLPPPPSSSFISCDKCCSEETLVHIWTPGAAAHQLFTREHSACFLLIFKLNKVERSRQKGTFFRDLLQLLELLLLNYQNMMHLFLCSEFAADAFGCL